MSDVTWYPEGGFYEKQSGQGEDDWSDQAQFDIIDAPSERVLTTANNVAWDMLTAPASQTVKPFEKPNS